MGMSMSFMGLGGVLPSAQMLNFVMGMVYKQFMEKDIEDFEEFHVAILDIFNTFTAAFPDKHYDVPSRKKIEAVFRVWKAAKEQDFKNIFFQFMKTNVNLSRFDNATLITGIVTPPVAIAAKRAGENVPQLKLMKAIPDIVFVPLATLLALISVKISGRIFMGKKARRGVQKPFETIQIEPFETIEIERNRNHFCIRSKAIFFWAVVGFACSLLALSSWSTGFWLHRWCGNNFVSNGYTPLGICESTVKIICCFQ